MDFVANYEVAAECSVVVDGIVLEFKNSRAKYRARIQNIPRDNYQVPFLLSLHIYFDAPSFDSALEVADDCLADCMNMLAFTTGGSFRRHRIRQIVDASQRADGMRSLLMWSDSIEYEDPEPMLRVELMRTIERLLESEIAPPVRRAMRWYRLGVNATVPDDQFTNFWFAIEILAEYRKSTDKVPSKCPRCHSPLYCQECETHPMHRPYPKQAIRALLMAVDPDCDDALVKRLDETRNSLMHGSTLREIEDRLPQPHEEIVDVLGRLLWRALIDQFPREIFDGSLLVGCPSTYIHRRMNAVAHMKTVVPIGADGNFDLRFSGTKAQLVPFGPPQSALPHVIRMGLRHYERLARLAHQSSGGNDSICRRVYEKARVAEEEVQALVLATDMELIREAIGLGQTGPWQDLFREILEPQ